MNDDNQCNNCGRRVTAPLSRILEIGPECAKAIPPDELAARVARVLALVHAARNEQDEQAERMAA